MFPKEIRTYIFIPGSIPPVRFGPVGTDPPDGSISPVTYVHMMEKKHKKNTNTVLIISIFENMGGESS